MKNFKLFLPFFKGYGKKYLGGAFFLIIINMIMFFVPHLTGKAIDTLNNDKLGLTTYIIIFFLMAIVVTILKYFSRHLLLGSIRRLEFYLRRDLFSHALAIPTSYYEENGPGKVMALMTNDVTSLRVSLGLGVMIFLDAIFFGIFSFLILAYKISFSLTVLILFPMPFIIISMIMVSHRMRTKQREAQNTYSDLTEYAQELFLGFHIIRSFNKETSSLERFARINRTNYEKNLKVALLDSILAPITYISPFVCYAIDIYVCGKLVLENSITVGDFVAINGYLILIMAPLMGLGSLSSVLQKGLASLDRLSAFLRIPEEEQSHHEGLLELQELTAKNLNFSYTGSSIQTLTNVNFTIKPGSFIGIVGAPGSGKSTLFKLLTRLQNPSKNQLFIGNTDIMDIPLDLLRHSFAYVPTMPFILGGTIKENISFGDFTERHLSVEDAAQKAALTRDLGERIETNKKDVKENGVNLSGGQKQRINIARGLYKNAPYLLMDDSFSALDTLSVSNIIKTLRSTQEQTLLFISQRIEALKNADEIWVFKDGAIVEKGTHTELLNKQGEYHQLYARQFERKEQV